MSICVFIISIDIVGRPWENMREKKAASYQARREQGFVQDKSRAAFKGISNISKHEVGLILEQEFGLDFTGILPEGIIKSRLSLLENIAELFLQREPQRLDHKRDLLKRGGR